MDTKDKEVKYFAQGCSELSAEVSLHSPGLCVITTGHLSLLAWLL